MEMFLVGSSRVMLIWLEDFSDGFETFFCGITELRVRVLMGV